MRTSPDYRSRWRHISRMTDEKGELCQEEKKILRLKCTKFDIRPSWEAYSHSPDVLAGGEGVQCPST